MNIFMMFKPNTLISLPPPGSLFKWESYEIVIPYYIIA